MVILGIAIICAFICSVIAGTKARSAGGFFLMGLLLGPVGVAIAIVLPANSPALESGAISSGSMKKCPMCAELVRSEASKCRHCGTYLSRSEDSIGSKVAGVTKRNNDGSDRQEIIKSKCRPGDPLILKREADNPYDPNAVKVLLRSGEQIGYLNEMRAEQVSALMAAGKPMLAKVLEVTGGRPGENFGVNIEIYEDGDIPRLHSWAPPETPKGPAFSQFALIIGGLLIFFIVAVGACTK